MITFILLTLALLFFEFILVTIIYTIAKIITKNQIVSSAIAVGLALLCTISAAMEKDTSTNRAVFILTSVIIAIAYGLYLYGEISEKKADAQKKHSTITEDDLKMK